MERSRKWTMLAVAILLLWLRPSPLRAQSLSRIEYGTTVRATLTSPVRQAPTRWTLSGSLVDISDESITIELIQNGRPVVVPRTQLHRLETPSSRSGRFRRPAVGFSLGLVLAFVVGPLSSDEAELCFPLCATDADRSALLALVLAPLGAVLGGLSEHGESWRVLSHDRIRLEPDMYRGRDPGLSISMKF